MRVYKLAAFVAMALWSCSKEPRESGGLVLHTISAGIGETTKTQLAADGDKQYKQVLWSVGDQVDVWVGETAYTFNSTTPETAMYSEFQGLAPADMGTSWVLVYPKGASTGKSGNVISATLPATQTARANSYDPSAALLYGVSETAGSTTCKHLYSGIRIMFTQTEIRRVSLRGNAGEKIAGDFTFDYSDGTISSGTSETIVLNAPDGGTFETGKWYFILCLPTVFSRGITITADNGSQVGYFTTGTSTTFSRAIIKNKESFTIENWADIGSAGTVHYGPANTICLRKGASTTIDVTPWLTTAGWQRCGLETAVAAAVPNGTQVLWGNSTASLSGTTLTLNASATEGSSLVAIKKNGSIIWSYLIWVTESAPAGNVLPPLGGQLYFQWGRKDPLNASSAYAGNQGTGGLSYSISHPCDFIANSGSGNGFDWFTDNFSGQDDALWGEGGSKTVWDPCPSGYRVPSSSDSVSGTSYNYGYLTNGGDVLMIYSCDIYWSRDAYKDYTPHKSYYSGSSGHQYRYIAYPVRCIKE